MGTKVGGFQVVLGVVVLCFGLFPGCGSRGGLPDMVRIEGTVTYNGQLLKQGTVLYLPKTPGGRQARGEITDGEFKLTTLRDGDGAQQGEYDVVVIAYEPYAGDPTREEIEAAGGLIRRGHVIPEKYTKAATSGLSDVVDENHSGSKSIVLKD